MSMTIFSNTSKGVSHDKQTSFKKKSDSRSWLRCLASHPPDLAVAFAALASQKTSLRDDLILENLGEEFCLQVSIDGFWGDQYRKWECWESSKLCLLSCVIGTSLFAVLRRLAAPHGSLTNTRDRTGWTTQPQLRASLDPGGVRLGVAIKGDIDSSVRISWTCSKLREPPFCSRLGCCFCICLLRCLASTIGSLDQPEGGDS